MVQPSKTCEAATSAISLPLRSVWLAMTIDDREDNAQSILDKHMSQVWANSNGQTPTWSPGRHSPDCLKTTVPHPTVCVPVFTTVTTASGKTSSHRRTVIEPSHAGVDQRTIAQCGNAVEQSAVQMASKNFHGGHLRLGGSLQPSESHDAISSKHAGHGIFVSDVKCGTASRTLSDSVGNSEYMSAACQHAAALQQRLSGHNYASEK